MGWVVNMTPPLPDASKKSPRVYRNLQTKDLQNVTFSDVEATGDPLSIELHNEDELRRLVLVQLARLTTKSEWNGLLNAGGGGGGMTSFSLQGDSGTTETVTNGNTVKVLGGTGISTAGSTPDTITITNSGQFSLEADSGATQFVPTDGTGTLSIDGGTGISTATGGANDQVVVTNTGVTSLVAGSNITLSGSTGAVTVSASGGGGTNNFDVNLVSTPLGPTANYMIWDVLSLPPYGSATYQNTAQGSQQKQAFFPFIAPKTGNLGKMHVNIVTSATDTQTLYCTIWSTNSNGLPDAIQGYGEFDVRNNVGATSISTFYAGGGGSTTTISLTKGTQYFMSFNNQNTRAFEMEGCTLSSRARIAPLQNFTSFNNNSGSGKFIQTSGSVFGVPSGTVAATGLESGNAAGSIGPPTQIGLEYS